MFLSMEHRNYLYIEWGQTEMNNIKCCKTVYLRTSASLPFKIKMFLCILSSEKLVATCLSHFFLGGGG